MSENLDILDVWCPYVGVHLLLTNTGHFSAIDLYKKKDEASDIFKEIIKSAQACSNA